MMGLRVPACIGLSLCVCDPGGVTCRTVVVETLEENRICVVLARTQFVIVPASYSQAAGPSCGMGAATEGRCMPLAYSFWSQSKRRRWSLSTLGMTSFARDMFLK